MDEQETLSGCRVGIAGAGPAGASLAVRLARAGIHVVLVERAEFPRHKLCGEFISPECLLQFEELGVLNSMTSVGGDRIGETVFYSKKGNSVTVPSGWFSSAGAAALGLSRAEMDNRLLEQAKRHGARVIEGTSVSGLLVDRRTITGMEVKNGDGLRSEIKCDLLVDATGRSAVLAGLVERLNNKRSTKGTSATRRPERLLGFKAHLEDVRLPKGRCEIYFFDGGYGGLSYVEDGVANHCFLIRADAARTHGFDADRIVRELVRGNTRAAKTLEGAKRRTEWLAVVVNDFGQKNPVPANNVYAVGDSSAFIDPFTGSGMLMALESAEMLSDHIIAGATDAGRIGRSYGRSHKERFGRRLRICALMRKLSYSPALAGLAISVLGRSEKARQVLAETTRNGRDGKPA